MTKTSFAIRVAAPLIALLVAADATIASAQSQEPETPAVAAFTASITDYVRMHRRLEEAVGRIQINSSVEQINRSMAALASAIRVERAGARQGDLFTPVLARELRARINDALLEHGFTAGDVLASEREDWIERSSFQPQVNGPFFWVLATAMFPCVIEALPPLPSELQYRIVGNDLMLVDVHASLIVDILPNALADETVRSLRPEGAVR